MRCQLRSATCHRSDAAIQLFAAVRPLASHLDRTSCCPTFQYCNRVTMAAATTPMDHMAESGLAE